MKKLTTSMGKAVGIALISGPIAVASLVGPAALQASAAPQTTAAHNATAQARAYDSTGGSALINTSYGSFGLPTSAGDATITTTDNSVNGFTFNATPIADGSLGSYISWKNAKVALKDTATSGSITATTATVNTKGLEMDISGSVCATYGVAYCNTFSPDQPLRIYLSPTSTKDTNSTISATGNARPNESFSVQGNGYANVDTTTWTGWALSYLIDGDSFQLNLDMARRNVAPTVPTDLSAEVVPSLSPATAGKDSARLAWMPPATDAGTPITGYTVSDGNGQVVKLGPDATSYQFQNLNPTHTYPMSVVATNAVGNSPAATFSITMPAA